MIILVPSFLDGSSSFLQLTSTTKKAWISFNVGKITSLTSELAALECQKNHFYWIFFIIAGNKDAHKISNGFEIQPDPTLDCGVSCP